MTRPADDDPLMTAYEVASLLRVERVTVSRWAAHGRIPAMKTPGGQYRFRRSVVAALFGGGS